MQEVYFVGNLLLRDDDPSIARSDGQARLDTILLGEGDIFEPIDIGDYEVINNDIPE